MDPFTEDDVRQMVLRLAHEIRNPLATIKSSIQLVEHLTRPQGEIADYLTSAVHEVDRVDQTVRKMQSYVRLKPGPQTPVRVEDLVHDALSDVRETARQHRVRLTAEVDGESTVRVDPDQLRLGLAELLSNAVRFAPAESQVTVIGRKEDRGEKAIMAIHVDDEGPGIPEEREASILRLFFSSSTHGAGLGLNIVDKVAAFNGGRLVWQNRTGGGCRFTLELPDGKPEPR